MSNLLKVWSRFSTVVKKTGDVCNFRIMDMPDSLRSDVLNLYMEHYVKQEAVYKAVGVPNSVKALNEVYVNMLKAAEKPEFHTIICCKDDGDEQIKEVVGASMMTLQLRGHVEEEWKFETQEVKKLLEIVTDLAESYDEMKVFNLDRNFSDRGMFVCPGYRGHGIIQKLLNTRRKVCKEHGIPINGGWASINAVQKAADRDGWETVCEIPFQELSKKHGVTFEDKNTPSCKFVLARTDNV